MAALLGESGVAGVVVGGARAGVGEDVVGDGEEVEGFGGQRVGVLVGVPFEGLLAEGFAQEGWGGLCEWDTEDFVEVCGGGCSVGGGVGFGGRHGRRGESEGESEVVRVRW